MFAKLASLFAKLAILFCKKKKERKKRMFRENIKQPLQW